MIPLVNMKPCLKENGIFFHNVRTSYSIAKIKHFSFYIAHRMRVKPPIIEQITHFRFYIKPRTRVKFSTIK